MNNLPQSHDNYPSLLQKIGETLESGRKAAYQAVSTAHLMTNWEIGRHIVEYEQKGSDRAQYGAKLLGQISKDLTLRHGKGFGQSNVYYMRQFYLRFQNFQTSGKLEWGHYCELLSLEDELERSFYLKQCELERWAVRELRRQIKSMLFHRIALSKDKEGVLQLAREGQRIQQPEDLLRNPFTLEFLGLPEKKRHKEKDIESRLIAFLQDFLLEMGKGFAFIGRQYRIQIDGNFYRVDLLFYHRILKCFVVVDLKTGTANHGDVGQMNMYLNYFKHEENQPDDNEPIGIILAANKSRLAIEYALGGLSNQIFVSRYQLYLPDRQALEDKLQDLLDK
jgi:predicted nuclease of restriction endonuclease-like (RecB) superfamily